MQTLIKEVIGQQINMTVYKNKAPFMTRIGQFEPNKQTLVVGVDMDTLAKHFVKQEDFKMTVGKSETLYYLKAEKIKQVKHTEWNNKQNKKVWIIPLSEFGIFKK